MMNNLLFQGNPGNGGGLPACDTPNPPFWCDGGQEPPAASIDQLLIAFLIMGVILGIWYSWDKSNN